MNHTLSLDSNFIANLNIRFPDLDTFDPSYITPDAITNTQIGQDLVDKVNGNFTKFDGVLPSAATPIALGMKGSAFLNALNGSFTAKGTSLQPQWINPKWLSEILRDNGTLAFYDPFDLSTVTKDGSNIVTRINDKLGSGHDLTLGSCGWSATNGLTFSKALGQYLKSIAWVDAVQPYMVYLLVRQKTWTEGDYIFDGYTYDHGALKQHGSIESNYIYPANGGTGLIHLGLGLGEWGIIRILYNHENSFIKVNDYININGVQAGTIVGNWGSNNPGGFTLGGRAVNATAVDHFSDIDVQGIILRKVTDSTEDEGVLNNFFKRKLLDKYRFPEGKVMIMWDGDVMDLILIGHNILQTYGIKDTLYVCGDLTQQYIWDNIAIMAGHGTDIQYHGYLHPQYNEIPEAEIIQSIADTDNAITIVHGYPQTQHVAYPYGYSNALSRATFANYKLTGRGVRPCQLVSKPSYFFDLPAIGLGDFSNTPEGIQLIKNEVDYAILHKTILPLYIHGVRITGGGQEAAGFTEIAQYIAASGITDINATELYTLIS